MNKSTSTSTSGPLTFEVIRNKFSAITEEQATTLKNASGSPVVTEATDFNVGTYLGDGSVVAIGPQVLFHSGSMASVVRNTIADSDQNPGISEGDMFVLNDPYKGSLHQRDVSFVAPVCAGVGDSRGSAPARTRSTWAALTSAAEAPPRGAFERRPCCCQASRSSRAA